MDDSTVFAHYGSCGSSLATTSGASVHALNHSDTPTAMGTAYNPTTNAWRKLPPTDLDPNGTFAVWTHDEVFAMDYTNQVRAYDPLTNVWRDLPSPPTASGEMWPTFAPAGDEVFASTFGGSVVFDLTDERWRSVDLPRQVNGSLTPVAAGDAAVLWESASGGAPGELLVWVAKPTSASLPAGGANAQSLEGVPFPVCRATSIPGSFGDGHDVVWTFAAERTPGGGCSASPGRQYIGVGSVGGVELMSRGTTAVMGLDRAWWSPYATPDIDGDGVDEIVVATSYAHSTWSIQVWMYRVTTDSVAPVEQDCGNGCTSGWNTAVGEGGRRTATLR